MMRSPQQQEVMANRGGSFLWLALAGNLIVAGAVIFFVWQNHQDVERNTRKTIDNLVRLISQDIESEYRSIDLALRGVVDEFASTHAPKGDEIDLGPLASPDPSYPAHRRHARRGELRT